MPPRPLSLPLLPPPFPSHSRCRAHLRIALAPHNPQGPISTAASLEFGFSQPSYIICETVTEDVPWRKDIVTEGYTIEPKGQIVFPNTKPGLGIEINEEEIKKYPFKQELLQRAFNEDNSIGDW